MKPKVSADVWLALFVLGFALILALVWIPLDTGTGLVEKVRRKYVIGDALAPTIAALTLVIGGVLVLLRPTDEKALTRNNAAWCATLFCLFVGSLLLMRYAGPLAASWSEGGYRPLRATVPWKYIGFLLGGTVLVGGLTGIASRRFTVRDFAIGFAATAVIALAYDLPFDDLLLPPNGDV